MRKLAYASLLMLGTPAGATTLMGQATIIDGDTLEVGGKRIRLFGIDAPEGAQTCNRAGETWACGEASAEHLRSNIGDSPITCSGSEIDTYGRLVAVCSVAGVDLNQVMVGQGWATAFRRYSADYVADENRARAGKLGLWSSSFMLPEDYRAAHGQEAGAPQVVRVRGRAAINNAPSVNSTCVIKGNRGSNRWIYHLPGMPYYAQTRAEEIFCTEAQAQPAGYRRARVR